MQRIMFLAKTTLSIVLCLTIATGCEDLKTNEKSAIINSIDQISEAMVYFGGDIITMRGNAVVSTFNSSFTREVESMTRISRLNLNKAKF